MPIIKVCRTQKKNLNAKPKNAEGQHHGPRLSHQQGDPEAVLLQLGAAEALPVDPASEWAHSLAASGPIELFGQPLWGCLQRSV